ncbi:MAG TPA: DUF1294 domain-containing protein [Anaerolineaceae bacterium]|jgi:uncharacterized membrane protein YsdA (DUF1294 family)|nr:DUF1294 domain-containing protein [Anaerolineaceae bacterium]
MHIFYAIFSLITFITWGVDKYRARANLWRISERVLLTQALLGGAFGALAGMLVFRHKTRKPLFWVLVGLGCLIHTVILLQF